MVGDRAGGVAKTRLAGGRAGLAARLTVTATFPVRPAGFAIASNPFSNIRPSQSLVHTTSPVLSSSSTAPSRHAHAIPRPARCPSSPTQSAPPSMAHPHPTRSPGVLVSPVAGAPSFAMYRNT